MSRRIHLPRRFPVSFLGFALFTLAGILSVGTLLATFAEAPSPEDELPPEKAAALAEREAHFREGLANQAPVPDNPEEAGPKFIPDPFPEGIFGKEEAGFPPGLGFEFNNIWKKATGDWNVVVYAGARLDDPSEGTVMVMLVDPRSSGHIFEVYRAPVIGPVRINSANDLEVTLLSDRTGERFLFDFASRSCRPDPCPRLHPSP
ncbi:MAG: hypothetical protein HYS09_01945 [Chloroflexi bacterium]|nr:hypothetical protein [Chloroflexota bacterium]